MKNNKTRSDRSRREFIKGLSAASLTSSLVVIDSDSLSAQETGSEDKSNSVATENEPRLNCAETVLSRANDLYQLGLTPENMTFAATFGGGMGIGETCGAVTGSMMVLGYLFRPPAGRDSPARKISVEFLETIKKRMGSRECRDLRSAYRTEKDGCEYIISTAMEVLDSAVRDNDSERIR